MPAGCTAGLPGACCDMRSAESWTGTGWKAVIGLAVALLSVAAVGCARDGWSDPPPVDDDVLAAEHEEWREGRRRSLANPNAGVVSWDGLFELREGANTFGSDPIRGHRLCPRRMLRPWPVRCTSRMGPCASSPKPGAACTC